MARQAIEVPSDALKFRRGETDIYLWRSEYNGVHTVVTAQRGPKTGNFIKMGVPSFDRELATAFVALADGYVTGAEAPAAPAPKKRGRPPKSAK